MTSGGSAARIVPSSGMRDLEFRQELEQVALELFVRAIDLVDQQHGRTRASRVDRLEQRPLDQESFRCTARVVRRARSTSPAASRMRSSSSCRA